MTLLGTENAGAENDRVIPQENEFVPTAQSVIPPERGMASVLNFPMANRKEIVGTAEGTHLTFCKVSDWLRTFQDSGDGERFRYVILFLDANWPVTGKVTIIGETVRIVDRLISGGLKVNFQGIPGHCAVPGSEGANILVFKRSVRDPTKNS